MSFSLTCLVAGYPAPSVTWYLNTGVFNPAFLSGVSYDREEGQLRIDQATDDFHGEYVCEARNKHGVVTSEPASVRVLGKSKRERASASISSPSLWSVFISRKCVNTSL